MYGPPPDCKRFEVERSDSLRKCIRPLSGESLSQALDDDPHVSVLINRSVTRDALSPPGFPTRRWTVLSSPSLLSKAWWNVAASFVVVAVEKWKAFCAFQAQSLFHGLSGCGHLQRLVLIVFVARQHGPGNASQFVGDRDNDLVARSTLSESVHPLPESSGVVLDAKQYRTSPVDQHATQIDVATFADAEQLLLAPGGVLPWHDADPCREAASPAKGSPVTDGGHCCGRDQRAEAADLAKPRIWRRRRQRASSLLMRLISSVIALTSISTCFHSCHRRPSRQRRRGLRFCSASSITPGRFLRRCVGSAAKVMPRSSKNPRISLISAVRRCTSRSRTRCMACTSS